MQFLIKVWGLVDETPIMNGFGFDEDTPRFSDPGSINFLDLIVSGFPNIKCAFVPLKPNELMAPYNSPC